MNASTGTRICGVRRCGRVGYAEALALQDQLVAAVQEGRGDEAFLLLEHPHVLTLGRNAHEENVLLDAAELARRGIERFEVGRGGDVTYHGPGQLVGYPILQLGEGERDAHAFLRALEEVLLLTLADFGIEAFRKPPHTGAWLRSPRGDEKIAAIGVRLSKWVTSHGFALNVDCDLDFFETIVPCGIREYGVTSMSRVLGRVVDMEEVMDRIETHFASVMRRRTERRPFEGTGRIDDGR